MRQKALLSFFGFARERHLITLKRMEGLPAPWTDDEVLRTNRFTNVFRELDTTTIWFRESIRDPLRDSPWVVPATVIFRWFNRITTGQIMLDPAVGLLEGRFWASNFEQLMRARYPNGPWVTGSYMVFSGKNNGDKLTGLLSFIAGFMEWWEQRGGDQFRLKPSMRKAHELLSEVDGLSGFTAYEVVTDLRWTKAVHSGDCRFWAHTGPGATRGVSRLLYGAEDRLRQESLLDQELCLKTMRELLRHSGDPEYWPQNDLSWPAWELREVEHTLCEYDKYLRIRRGQGQTKRRFYEDRSGPLQRIL